MASFTYFIILYFFISVTCKPELDLLITTKNANGVTTPVLSPLKATLGDVLLLSCKVIENEEGEINQAKVVWGKKKTKHKLAEHKTINAADLNITSVNVEDQGVYFCASLKHKLYKTVTIIIDSKEFLNKPQETVHTNTKYKRDLRHDGYNYWDDTFHDDFRNNFDRERERIEKEFEEEKIARTNRKKTFKTVAIIVGCVVAGVALVYLIYKCIAKSNNSGQQSHNTCINNLIVENRQLNERVTRLAAERSNPQVPNLGVTAQSQAVGWNATAVPTAPSTKAVNGTTDQPPSYHEVMAKIQPTAPPCIDSK